MKRRYGAIDGLRTMSAIGIIMMHIAANNHYEIKGYIYERIIPSFTDFVFLFMMISAFGMCCGYYEKILGQNISIPVFYKKRFCKVLPFFSVLVILDIFISHSISSLYEGFADLTLLYGLLPYGGNIEVIGVGWFLGLIFVFYLCFPFFCFLIENRKRAWVAFGISLIYNFVCYTYFNIGRQNILYDGCFFLAGGLIYLYRNKLTEFSNRGEVRCFLLGMIIFSVAVYYIIGGNTVTRLLVSMMLLIYAMNSFGGVLENRITKFISEISMEIYLSHMVVFRGIEKMNLNIMIGNGWLQYIAVVIFVMAGTIIFSVVIQKYIFKILR